MLENSQSFGYKINNKQLIIATFLPKAQRAIKNSGMIKRAPKKTAIKLLLKKSPLLPQTLPGRIFAGNSVLNRGLLVTLFGPFLKSTLRPALLKRHSPIPTKGGLTCLNQIVFCQPCSIFASSRFLNTRENALDSHQALTDKIIGLSGTHASLLKDAL